MDLVKALYDETFVRTGHLSENAQLVLSEYAEKLVKANFEKIYDKRTKAHIALHENPQNIKKTRKTIHALRKNYKNITRRIEDLRAEGKEIEALLSKRGILSHRTGSPLHNILCILSIGEDRYAKRSVWRPFSKKGLSRKEYKRVIMHRDALLSFQKNHNLRTEDLRDIHAKTEIERQSFGARCLGYQGLPDLERAIENHVKHFYALRKSLAAAEKDQKLDLRVPNAVVNKNNVAPEDAVINEFVDGKSTFCVLNIPQRDFQTLFSLATEQDLDFMDSRRKEILLEAMRNSSFSFSAETQRTKHLHMEGRKYKRELYHKCPWIPLEEDLPKIPDGHLRVYHGNQSPVIHTNEAAAKSTGDDGLGFYTATDPGRARYYVEGHNAELKEKADITGGYFHVLTLKFTRSDCLENGQASREQRNAITAVLTSRHGKSLEQLEEKHGKGRLSFDLNISPLAKAYGRQEALDILHEAGVKGNFSTTYNDIIVFKPEQDVVVEGSLLINEPLRPQAVVLSELKKAGQAYRMDSYYKKDFAALTSEEFRNVYSAAWANATHGQDMTELVKRRLDNCLSQRNAAGFEHVGVLKSTHQETVTRIQDQNGKFWSKRQPVQSGYNEKHLHDRLTHYEREASANAIYRLCGMDAPETFVGRDGCLYREFIDPAERSAHTITGVQNSITQGVAVDIFLNNWDLVSNDNVLRGQDGKIWRMDNGSAFDFTGKGVRRDVLELEDPGEALKKLGRKEHIKAVPVYGKFGDKDVALQFKEILEPRKEQILSLVPPDLLVHYQVRFDKMKEWSKQVLQQEKRIAHNSHGKPASTGRRPAHLAL